MILKCNAKINLSLKIIGKRDDGYHLIDSVFLPINLNDIIKIRKTKQKKSKVLINNKLCNYKNNICLNLINYLEERFNIKDRYIFDINKRIPLGGGLGGGSSDAAEIFKFYKDKYNLLLSNKEINKILVKFGADIPFFYINKPARVQGIGEKVKLFSLLRTYYVLLINPGVNSNTKEVYDFFDKSKCKSNIDIKRIIYCLQSNNIKELNDLIGNDLEVPATKLYKEINIMKNHLNSLGIKNIFMTGSGSTLFLISNNKKELSIVYKKLKKENVCAYLVKTMY